MRPRVRRTPDRTRARPVLRVGAAVAALVTGCVLAAPAAAATGPGSSTGSSTGATGTYRNPVTQGYSIDFPDPAVFRGKDGVWYAYATGGPFDEQGKRSANSKIAKSTDLVHWSEVGPLFSPDDEPAYAAKGTGYWAPDIRYLNGKYVLYYTVPDTTVSTQTFDPEIGVATAETPAGPWKPASTPVIPAKTLGTGYDTVIDPALFTDDDGQHYLYYGGFGSGLYVVKMSADGMRATSEPTHITRARYEGSYVVHRDGWYYLFASSANCCAGPTTGYSVFTGRARSPMGPFRDKLGQSLLASRTGGTPVIAPNGNRWIGTGHHSALVDQAGRDWMAYHAIDKADPWLDVQPGFTMRPMNLDHLDWVGGWPIVNRGSFASDDTRPAPVTRGTVDDRFEDAATTKRTFTVRSGSLAVAGPDPQSGGYADLGADTVADTKALGGADVRVEADVRTEAAGRTGVAARVQRGGTEVRALLDTAKHRLVVESAVRGHVVATASRPVPAGYDATAWHTLALEVRGRTASADLTDDRLGDPWASVRLDLPPGTGRAGAAGLRTTEEAQADNVSANALAPLATSVVPDPARGTLDRSRSSEFSNGLGDGWSWVRKDDEAKVRNGTLSWPTEQADLSGDGQTAGVLLHTTPKGAYTVETKLGIDTGVDTVRNFQQGGLVVYAGDDEFLRLDVVAVGDTRIVEFGKETVFQGRKSFGGGLIGAPGATTYLRIKHTVDPVTGEQRYRGGSSTDGTHWTWGVTWTMPKGTDARIGLVSQGSSAATEAAAGKATSRFDYVRFYR